MTYRERIFKESGAAKHASASAISDVLGALMEERDKAKTALRMIRDNEHGESWSAGVAMSALHSIEYGYDGTRCAFVTAAGIQCCRDHGHAGAHDTLSVIDGQKGSA